MKIFAIIAGLLFATNVFASGFDVSEAYVHTYSHHFISNKKHNNANYGLGVEFQNHIVGGFYYNSFYKTTMYVGYNVHVTNWFNLAGGVATGYRDVTGKAFLPFGVIGFTYPVDKHWRASLNIVPVKRGVANATIGYKW